MQDFESRVAVVTGGGSGIGEALAHRLGRAGMKLVVADIDADAANSVAAALGLAGVEALAVVTDVSDSMSVEALADAAFARFGAVHVLCNNAGIVPSGRFRPVWDYPLEDWRWAFDVNLMGIVHGIRSFIPRMLAQNAPGHVVNTASVAGFVSGSGSPVYSASKHAAVRASEALYASLRQHGAPIGVTILSPGVVATRISESERNRPQRHAKAEGAVAESATMESARGTLASKALSAAEVAEMAFDAIRANRLYQFTTASFDEAIRVRMAAILERCEPEFPDLLALALRESESR